ncbi:hypothetical protein GGF46_004276 [Coemansia sp. RSA 552]|nr:hypothetical protein GGF46_004276 [Coemansia sp. RSA 552]
MSTTGSAAAEGNGKKDPWSSTYLQRRLNGATPGAGGAGAHNAGAAGAGVQQQRPLSTAYGPLSGTAGASDHDDGRFQQQQQHQQQQPARRMGHDRFGSGGGDLGLARPRAVRDATGPRPASMYATGSILDGPVQSAIERTIAPKGSSSQLRSAGHSPGSADQSPRLRSKWSQYFASTGSPQVSLAASNAAAAVAGMRGRSESMTASAGPREPVSPVHVTGRSSTGAPMYSPKRTGFPSPVSAAAAAGSEAASFAHMQQQQQPAYGDRRRSSTLNPTPAAGTSNLTGGSGYHRPVNRPLGSTYHRPLTSDGPTNGQSNRGSSNDTSKSNGQAGAASRRYGGGPASTPRPLAGASPEMTRPSPRIVNSAFDTRKRTAATGAGRTASPLSPAQDVLRSRSATLPDLNSGGKSDQPCTTCARVLRAEEQRQFASKPGVVYCADCYHSSYSRGHCAGCNKIVLTHGRPWVQCGGKVWHKLCIKCTTCSKMLITPLVDLEGRPTCEPCFMKSHPADSLRPMPTDAPAETASAPVSRSAAPTTTASVAQTRPTQSRIPPLGLQRSAQQQSRTRHTSVSSDMTGMYGSGEAKAYSQRSAADDVASSIPTPALTEYDDRAPSGGGLTISPDVASLGGHFHAMDLREHIMSPVEVAEKEGLPLPRHIVDPDLGAISRSESQVPKEGSRRSSPTPAPRPPSTSSRRSLPQSRNISSSSASATNAIRSMLNPSVTPIDTGAGRQPLSPSLKNPNSPTARTASPRSVSFRIDEPPQLQLRLDEEEEVEGESVNTSAPVAVKTREYEQEEKPTVQKKSLADYVLSKASGTTAKPKTKLPSVADTIKKFSTGGFPEGSATRRTPATTSKTQLPELKDMIRTHQREPPTEPTIPALDKHSRLLKSRPRNNNRRHRPSQTPASIQSGVEAAREKSSPQPPPARKPTTARQPTTNQQQDDNDSGVDADQFVPNQCARCTNSIEDTWFRLSDGRQVHVECFTCQGCDRLIDDGVYVLENNIEYHPQCVPPTPPIVAVSPVPSSSAQSNSSRVNTPSSSKPRGPRGQRREEACDRCQAVLSGPRFQLTNGKQYHPECFACAGCGQRFDEGSYVCFEGQEYHHQCVEKFAAANANLAGVDTGMEDERLTCGECSGPIEGVFLRHNNAVFHPNCFCCLDCQRAITPGMPFGEIEGRPCCESCLESRAQEQQRRQQQQQQQQQTHGGWANNKPHHQVAKTGY